MTISFTKKEKRAIRKTLNNLKLMPFYLVVTVFILNIVLFASANATSYASEVCNNQRDGFVIEAYDKYDGYYATVCDNSSGDWEIKEESISFNIYSDIKRGLVTAV